MLLQDYGKQRPRKDAIERLLELAREGRVDLAVTARIREDIPDEPLASEIKKLAELKRRDGVSDEARLLATRAGSVWL